MLDYLGSGYAILEHESRDILVDRQIRKAVVTAL